VQSINICTVPITFVEFSTGRRVRNTRRRDKLVERFMFLLFAKKRRRKKQKRYSLRFNANRSKQSNSPLRVHVYGTERYSIEQSVTVFARNVIRRVQRRQTRCREDLQGGKKNDFE